MSDFRECVLLVFQRIGLGEPPASYVDELLRLNEAAGEWHQQHASMGYLEFDLPDLLDGGTIATGNLNAAASLGWARNAAARHFIAWIDERTGRRATLLMLQVIMLLQQLAAEAKEQDQPS